PGLGNFVSVYVDAERNLWMASGGLHGVSRARLPFLHAGAGEEKRVESLTAADGLASNDARLIFEDRSHDIWIGTISGLQRLHRGIFTSYTPGDEATGSIGHGSLSQVDAVFEQKDGSLWIGTLEGGVARFKDGAWRVYSRADGLKPGQVRGFAEDGSLPAVAISDYGIFAHGSGAGKSGGFAKIPDVPGGYLTTPMTASDGSLWFAVQRKGLFRRIHGKIVHYGAAEGVPEDEAIGLIALDAAGTPWVGAGSQLLRWNGTRFEKVLSVPLPALCAVWSQKAVNGKILPAAVGTRGGLFFPSAKPGEGRMLTEKDGLPGEMALDVNEDAEGNLWITTTRAIARISREQWMGFAEGRLYSVHAEIYTRADGLGSNTVLPLPAVSALRAHDGRMIFATGLGFSALNLELGPSLNPEPAVMAVIDSVKIDDREQVGGAGGSLTVPPGQHRITFTYTTPPAPAPEQMRFRYRLSGWDRAWIEAGNAREVSYTALPPGSYTFEVSAITRSNRESASPARLGLQLKPYFWQTRWFLTLAALALAALLIEITRRRTRAGAERQSLQFQERAAERERIAYQIHDTVIQDMIGAALQMETVSFQISGEPEKASSNLNLLAQRLRETIARSRNMVWSLHSTAVVQYSLLEVLKHAEAEFRLGEKPSFELTSKGEPRDVHPLVRDEVYRICREALANAFRHSNAEMVRVELRFLPDALEVEICDDGEGIDEETRKHGRPGHFGLPGMQAHAQRIGAEITIVSSPGAGARILLRVKTRKPRWRWRREPRSATVVRSEEAI
ncbi:MAG TPA: ATP-binding protein, partial [Acidobacteriaceae bacterium]